VREQRRYVSSDMDRPTSCSIGRAMELLGERWTMLILREAFWGVRRFTELQRNLGIARNILSSRLQALVAAEILERRLYRADPERFEYVLTEKGRDLYPAIVAIMRWGDQHLCNDNGPPLVLVHESCGEPLDQRFICWSCDETISPTAIRSTPGPGAQRTARAES